VCGGLLSLLKALVCVVGCAAFNCESKLGWWLKPLIGACFIGKL
jgi:hypothetical protein